MTTENEEINANDEPLTFDELNKVFENMFKNVKESSRDNAAIVFIRKWLYNRAMSKQPGYYFCNDISPYAHEI